MNWSRVVLGPPGRHLGAARWPLAAIGGAVLAVAFAYLGDWTFAAVFAALALLGVLGIVRRWER